MPETEDSRSSPLVAPASSHLHTPRSVFLVAMSARRRNVDFYRHVNGQQTAFLVYQLWGKIRDLERKPPVTIALIALNLVSFAAGSAQRSGPFGDIVRTLPKPMVSFLARIQPYISISKTCVHPRRVIGLGERWRLISSTLIHIDERHVLFNMLSFVHKVC